MPRILFVKTSSLGDVVHHCPAVADAARALPGAALDWVVEEAYAPLVALHRDVRRAIPVALRRWRARLLAPATRRELGHFCARLRAEHYDAVIDTQGLIKSALLARLARGWRHGPDAASARERLATLFYEVRHPVPRERHAVERNRLLAARALGYSVPEECDYALVAPRAGAARDCAVLLAMASRPEKLWPVGHWREVARALAAQGLRVVLPWGEAAERRRGLEIAEGIAGADVPDRMDLPDLAALLAQARIVIGLDTGLSHLAAALGAPTVGVYGASDPGRTGLHGAARVRNCGAPGRFPEPAEVLSAAAALGRR